MDLRNDFSLVPVSGPPRIFRYFDPPDASPHAVDGRSMAPVAFLDLQQNILKIRRDYFDRLPELDRHRVLRTREEAAYVAGDGLQDPAGYLRLLTPQEVAARLEAAE